MILCYIHVPKTGGHTIETTLKIPPSHSPASMNCTQHYMSIRDPVEKLSSAYNFCKAKPWNRLRVNKNHCCHSNILQRNFDDWIQYIIDNPEYCNLVAVGAPHSYIAPNKYWMNGISNISMIRTHCLSFDMKRYFNVSVVKQTNRSPNTPCPKIREDTWNSILSIYELDFKQIYRIQNLTYSSWKHLCFQKSCDDIHHKN